MRFASNHLPFGVVACALLALAGCKGTIMPRLESPGTAGYQRYNALQFDPYPLDDVAPPVAGGRPKEYDRPIPEVQRGQKFTPKRPNLQPIAIPSFAPSPAPVITTPPPTVSPFAPPAAVPYQQAVPYQPTMPPVLPTTPPARPPY
jgi:hypothetical protein